MADPLSIGTLRQTFDKLHVLRARCLLVQTCLRASAEKLVLPRDEQFNGLANQLSVAFFVASDSLSDELRDLLAARYTEPITFGNIPSTSYAAVVHDVGLKEWEVIEDYWRELHGGQITHTAMEPCYGFNPEQVVEIGRRFDAQEAFRFDGDPDAQVETVNRRFGRLLVGLKQELAGAAATLTSVETKAPTEANRPETASAEAQITTGLESHLSALTGLCSALESYCLGDSPSETGMMAQPIWKDHPVHRSVVAVQKFYAGKLPTEAIGTWRRLLKLSRSDDEEAEDAAQQLLEWAGSEVERLRRGRFAQSVDFLIVAPLKEEREAIFKKFKTVRRISPATDDVRTYFMAELPIELPDGGKGQYTIVIVSPFNMGRVEAATATQDAIRRWRPRNVLLVGIAGGIQQRGVCLGDILIADQVVDAAVGKITTQGEEPRWQVHRSSPRLLQAIQNLEIGDCLTHAVEQRPEPGKPSLHVGPILSVDKVVACKQALDHALRVWTKLLGVEMEAGGVAIAASQAAQPIGFLMIRAVSDFADEAKNSEDVERWRPHSCDLAASCAIALLTQAPVVPSSSLHESSYRRARET